RAAARPRRRLLAGLALLVAGSALALVAAAGAAPRADALLAAARNAVHTGSIPVAALVLPAGAGYGLLSVALLELLDDAAPPHRQVEAFTWLTSAQALGLALGSLSAGALA
ncbi:hypothetical protein Q7L71_22275, partial [Conexibacter sp. CPCC 205706]